MSAEPASWKARYRGLHVAVFGATGFVGRWVAKALSEMGAELELVVRSRRMAEFLFHELGVRGRVHELHLREDGRMVRELVHTIQPSLAFNAIGYGVDPGERDERTAAYINTAFVGTLFEAIALTRSSWSGPRLVHIGSALEYGRAGGDLREDTTPDPTTAYGRTKLAGTRLVEELARETGVQALTARLFTVYGPGEHDGRLLPSLLRAVDLDQPLELTQGRQSRDFTYVEDVGEGLLRLGLSTPEPGEVVNLATGVLTPVRTFVEIAAQELEIPDERLLFGAIPTRSEEMAHDDVCVERLERLTSWRPATSIAQGVARTARFEARHGRWPSD